MRSALKAASASDRIETKDFLYQPLLFTQVHFTDVFWLPRIETNRTATIPFAFKQSNKPRQSDLGFNDSDTWKPVQNFSDYAVSLNAFNSVSFTPVVADALLLEVTFRENFSSGIQEWTVE